MTMHLLARLGILEIAFPAVLVPVLLFEGVQRLIPELLKDRRQLLSAHLDYFFMGILLILAGTVLQPTPSWIAALLVFGSLCNLTIFVVNAFSTDIPKMKIFRLFVILPCAALVWALAAMGVRAIL